MDVGVILILATVAILLLIGGIAGFITGKKREGGRWSKSANKSLIEFEHRLYEVRTLHLKKPILYDK